MKVNNLMVGDWVNYKGDNVRVLGIEAIFDLKMTIADHNDDIWFTAFEDVEPIPLTEEILKKNFNFDPNNSEGAFEHYWWSNGCLDVAITEYSDGIWEIEIDGIETGGLLTWKMYATHVHELQHVLKLCRIEKNIEL